MLTATKSACTIFEMAFIETLIAWFKKVVFGQDVTLRMEDN